MYSFRQTEPAVQSRWAHYISINSGQEQNRKVSLFGSILFLSSIYVNVPYLCLFVFMLFLRLSFAAFCVTCSVVNQVHISTYFFVFYHFCFIFSLSFVAIVSYCPYYSSSHASVKVREGSNYWGPLGYEALMSPKSCQSPDPGTASKRTGVFKFRKRKDSKMPLFQGQKR